LVGAEYGRGQFGVPEGPLPAGVDPDPGELSFRVQVHPDRPGVVEAPAGTGVL
jgi:hypothetical protein